MNVWAVGGGDLLADFIDQVFQDLHPLFGFHLEPERRLEVHAVAGHVKFRDDGDAAFPGISDQLTDVIETVGAVGIPARLAVTRIVELRISPALRSPGGVVGQMPVKGVEFVPRQPVELCLQQADRLEVPTIIVHQSPQGKGGPVIDPATRQITGSTGLEDQLSDRLHGEIEPGGIPRLDHNALTGNLQAVSLGRNAIRFCLSHHQSVGGSRPSLLKKYHPASHG